MLLRVICYLEATPQSATQATLPSNPNTVAAQSAEYPKHTRPRPIECWVIGWGTTPAAPLCNLGHTMYLAGQHRAGAVATKAPPPAHTNEHMQISDCSAALVDPAVSKVEADLACTEDAWDKDSPASKKPFPGRARARTSHAERAPLRRSRPGGSPSVFDCGPHEERLDVLVRMLSAEGKYQPERAPEGRVKCHIVSPFVAERRKWFVAWKVSEA